MLYETQVIYRENTDKSIFTWNGFTYYRTKSGKAKKQDKQNNKCLISEEEYQENLVKYQKVMGANFK